jgi:hypothetical protein
MDASGYGCSGSERFFDDVPDFAGRVDHGTEDWDD